ncbi:MAG: SCO family protein [Bacteroidales bacterium]|nr:SCO family protein [Bacteroidales bacterium]
MKRWLIFLFITGLAAACSHPVERLPVYGKTTIVGEDTLHSVVRPFSFINQDSIEITNHSFESRIYVTDFIFLSCPSICPIMTQQLKRVYEMYRTDPNVFFLSHTIDPENDTIPRLKAYTEDLGIDSDKWFFVTGDKDSIFSIANDSYFATAFADSTAPGGFIHSGAFLLIDTHRQIRGAYDGTDPVEAERLMDDIQILLAEEFPQQYK